jgi:N-acetylglucosaminyldiphosphoundecaprenol N-acetyl-beta-D-mannosaminyltransferase
MGFESDPRIVDSIRSRLTSVEPAIVYVGFGFPKQEILISQLATSTPNAWFVACGAAIPFAAGAIRRAPSWMQGAGLEWLYRLSKEPRRLFTRYIIRDLPFACGLLIDALLERWGDRFKPG